MSDADRRRGGGGENLKAVFNAMIIDIMTCNDPIGAGKFENGPEKSELEKKTGL